MTNEQVRTVTDAATLKAVAHPLRGKLLGSLRFLGPATASQLARRFGESSGSTSYHLRILEKHGFIEEDPQQPNARDRVWRAVHQYTSWNDADFTDDPAGLEAVRFLRNRQLENVINATRRYESEMDEWGPEWSAVAGHGDKAGILTPESLAELEEKVEELFQHYVDKDRDDPAARMVRMYLAAFPVNDTEL